MPIKSDREYRSMKLEADKTNENEFKVAGYATTFDSPYELWRDKDFVLYEQVSRDAFSETDMSDVIMQYDHQGRVYPCGEGAGYAGGITSAAMDGMYIAEELLSCYPIK